MKESDIEQGSDDLRVATGRPQDSRTARPVTHPHALQLGERVRNHLARGARANLHACTMQAAPSACQLRPSWTRSRGVHGRTHREFGLAVAVVGLRSTLALAHRLERVAATVEVDRSLRVWGTAQSDDSDDDDDERRGRRAPEPAAAREGGPPAGAGRVGRRTWSAKSSMK